MNFVILLVKEPVPGSVKTRLQSALSEQKSCLLYRAFVEDFLDHLKTLKNVCLCVAYHGRLENIQTWLGQDHYRYIAQGTGDLGVKMRRVFNWSFSQGAKRCVILGSDNPTLPASRINDALALLEKKDVVLGPAWDGGFYLIGLRHAENIFSGVQWSTNKVFEQVVFRVMKQGKKLGLIDPWYDIDELEQLRFLKRHLFAMRCDEGSCYNRIWRVLEDMIDL